MQPETILGIIKDLNSLLEIFPKVGMKNHNLKPTVKMKKIIKRLGLFLLCFTACLTIGYLTPTKWGNYSQTDCTVSVQIYNRGIHTEIIVPVKNEYFDWNQYLPLTEIGRDATSDYKYLSFGWGDRAFMLENPSSGSINPVTGFKALIFPNPSTVQVQSYRVFPQIEKPNVLK